MHLGNHSTSLAVKDIAASRAFYEKLGFSVIGGDQAQNWLILKNGDTKIGLFQGMFDANILTFNPGWDQNGEALSAFTDIRDISAALLDSGLELVTTPEPGTGPASLMLKDPDGNMILIDQHVDRAD